MTYIPRGIDVKTFRKGSRIFCVNGHCCARLATSVTEAATLEQLMAAIECVGLNRKNEDGLPLQNCPECGGVILYATPHTLH